MRHSLLCFGPSLLDSILIYEKAADRLRCLVNLGVTSGRGLAQQLPRQVGARHSPRDDSPFEARYGQSCLFEFTSIATCRTLEWYAEFLQIDV